MLLEKLMSKIGTRFLVGFHHHNGDSGALRGYTGWDFPALMAASTSLQQESQQVPASEPSATPLPSAARDAAGLLLPLSSLPGSTLRQRSSAHLPAPQFSCRQPIHRDNFLRITPETTD